MSESSLAASPHAHVESYLTGSTVANMVKAAKALGRTHFAYTDNGHLSSALKAYNLCKPSKDDKAKDYEILKRELKFIAGLEIYFKDSSCPFVTNTEADRCKYFTGTIYCKDQVAYQALCKMVSRTDMPTIEIYEETQQLWTWKDLEEISKFNVDFISGGVHCMVGKPMLAGRADVGMSIFAKLKSIFSDNFMVSLVAEPWSKKWSNVIEFKFSDGSKDAFLASDLITTDRARKFKAIELVEKKHHTVLKTRYSGLSYYEVDKKFDSVELHKGFLPLPGGDAQLRVNKFLLALARRSTTPILVSDYAYYAAREDKIVQTMVLEGRNKLYPNLYMKTGLELKRYLTDVLKIDDAGADHILRMNNEWAKRYDGFKLKYDWVLADVGPNPMSQINETIKKVGRMRWNDPMWVARLKEEMQVLAQNGVKDLTPYFLPICDVMNYYKDNGELTGPLRGSCGGSLLCYVLGITQVDPFKYDLPFNRFFSMDRVQSGKLPDVDSDLGDRTLLVGKDGKSGYIYGRYGDKCAQISTRNTIRLKSAIKDTNRYVNGSVEPEIEQLTKGLPGPGSMTDREQLFGSIDKESGAHIPGLIETSQELQKYIEKRPKEWDIVEKSLGITRSFGVHPAAFILADRPISDIAPLKDGHIIQYDMQVIDQAGLIKYDFLKVDQLKDIEVTLNLINKKNKEKKIIGNFTHDGKEVYIWDLPDIPEVFKSTWNGSTETLFQINTKSMTPFVVEILPQSIDDLGIILALVRPGPLDFIDEKTGRSMAEEYCMRRKGQSEVDIEILGKLIPETYGIFVYQESLTRIAKELGGFPGDEAEKLRENMGKKKMDALMKMKPKFIDGASQKVDRAVAEEIWERMVTFGRYGFNKSHSIGYAHITYACMFLRHFYPLEWWAAVLSNAKEQEITTTFWTYIKDICVAPDINLSSDMMVVDYANHKLRAKFGVIKGMGEKTIDPIVAGRPYADIQDFVNKDVAGDSISHKLIHVGILDSLFPPRMSLIEKLKAYEDAVQKKAYSDKIKAAEATGKKVRALAPKPAKIPEEYLNLDEKPLKDAAMRKSILPTLPISTYDLGKRFSKCVDRRTSVPFAVDHRGYRSILVGGDKLQRLDEMSGEGLEKDIYVASTVYVLKTQEFSFAKNTKRALKMIIDADGYISEKVLWPDFDGVLSYPPELDKGVIATMFFKKRQNKKDISVTSVVVES
jgi:DNA polymerase III alpha subunit